MVAWSRWGVILGCGFFVGCSTVDYRAQTEPVMQPPSTDGVDYYVSPRFDPEQLDCVTVQPVLSRDPGVSADVQRQIWEVVVAQIAPLNYRDEISDDSSLSACEGRIVVELLEMGDSNLLTYSEQSKALRLSLELRGESMWHAQHRLIARSGALPISPLALLMGAHSAQENVSDESGYLHDTRLIRRIVSTLPDRQSVPMAQSTRTDSTVAAEVLVEAGRYQEAIQTLTARPGRDDRVLWLLGRSYLAMGDATAAQEQFRNLLLLNPDTAKYWVGLGLAKRDLGQMAHATAAFDRALQLDSSEFTAHFELAVSLWQSDRDAAIAHFQRAGSLAVAKDQFALATRALYAMQSEQPEHLSQEELTLVY